MSNFFSVYKFSLNFLDALKRLCYYIDHKELLLLWHEFEKLEAIVNSLLQFPLQQLKIISQLIKRRLIHFGWWGVFSSSFGSSQGETGRTNGG